MAFNFSDLIVFDLANNHQGSIDHGRRIIREIGEVARRRGVRAGIKFQFRDLDTFIHPEHRKTSPNKHVGRFLSTRLEWDAFQGLAEDARREGMLTLCTPFDEASVDQIERIEFDILKIASCSAKDWPLLERAAGAGLPIVASTGGLTVADIDNLVSFFEHRGADFAIMHCVSIYPTPDADCQLHQIDSLIRRYPGRTIGWSTHEDPNDTVPAAVAYAKGARMFERHVGVTTEAITLNAYSSTPEQVDRWLGALTKAKMLCGATVRPPAAPAEVESIAILKRGVYAKHPLPAGAPVSRDQIYFAFPWREGQLDSGSWKDGFVPMAAVKTDAPLLVETLGASPIPETQIIKTAVHEVKALLNEARIPLSSEFAVEYSHHYGVQNFRETGAVLIMCINREYCKKLIVQLPGQRHPSHFHNLKEESFQVLSGTFHLEVDGRKRVMQPGDTALVLPGTWHSFWTDTGAIVEEISTTHRNNDSVYADPEINRKRPEERKTKVDHWGRFQIQLARPT